MFPNFPASNFRSACNRRRVPGTAATYIAQRGYAVPNFLALEAIYPCGELRQAATTSWSADLICPEAALSSEEQNVEILKEAYRQWHETRGGSVDHFISIVDENISFGSLKRDGSIRHRTLAF